MSSDYKFSTILRETKADFQKWPLWMKSLAEKTEKHLKPNGKASNHISCKIRSNGK
jgi:hypothetical protein